MPLKNFTLLFVEDDKTAQKHMQMILEDDVKEFYQALDGREGLTVFEDKNPDIIISDINLPFLNGLELTSEIKKRDKTKPVIIMSAYDDRDNLLNSINLGTAGFIPKPIDITLLYERLNAIAYTLEEQVKKSQKTMKKIEELHNLAHYDPLTQLPNRLLFNKILTAFIDKSLKNSFNFSLLFIDLDNFKKINDTYGHDAGDYVLQTITQSISNSIKDDNIVSRRSGDEFLVLLKNYSSKEEIEEIAYKILQETSKPLVWKEHIISTSCSIGISQFPYDSTEKNELLALADTAMYNAKELGKGNYFFAQDNRSFQLKRKKNNTIISLNSRLFWNKKHMQLIYKDKEIVLTKKEHLFLSLLFSSANYQASYEQIYAYLWGNEYLHKRENIKTLVKTLRKKVPEEFIVNIFGIGYKISSR
jgi:diguanylate cyclase (GGDEF)-like protein